jgi:hypothetical protein
VDARDQNRDLLLSRVERLDVRDRLIGAQAALDHGQRLPLDGAADWAARRQDDRDLDRVRVLALQAAANRDPVGRAERERTQADDEGEVRDQERDGPPGNG